MSYIRQATAEDLTRIAEIIVFNYRLNFYPIFQNDEFYFEELQVSNLAEEYEDAMESLWVYDDGVVKGVIQIVEGEVKKLFVEPILQSKSIGSALLDYAVEEHFVNYLWALEKNTRAITFYERHGFRVTKERKQEEDTTEYLVRLER